ncbi:Small-conductance mechanosensitive channel [Methylophilus rhizosphaerae]|uniref:Small-conductance mechanosensitive channel n=1 Tax=Methylophilus rhizosphaerae TaxID=492660 RepID=A0A1G9EQJ6_9PROT|nr:mechanosensitive ion channel family protein [Methylophilus rhizosphaerae]SDK78409.1 Small-conductance mechanosensitive channel [Methylophilus rhizosphaerae]
MPDWLAAQTLLGIPLYEWLYAALISAVIYLVLYNLWQISIKKLSGIAQRTATRLDDVVLEVLQGTHQLTILLLSLLFGLHVLELPLKWETRLDHVSFIVIGIQVAVWLNRGVGIWARDHIAAINGPTPAVNPVITSVLSWIFRIAIWSVLLLTILANVGINITAFVASLGVGGVAVALAVQNILGDLFASLAIGLDKPFEVGDFIVFGEVAGAIERVGLKTTRIRSISGEQIICSNTELLKNTIHNYKRMEERRVVFNFNVNYATPPDMIAQIPGIVRQAIESFDNTRFDRSHFKEFGASALVFETVYFITTTDFNLFMDIQQAVNLYLMKEFHAHKVLFAFNTMTLNVPDLQPDNSHTGLNGSSGESTTGKRQQAKH